MSSTNRILWVDYLRSSITVLVVAHHSTLSYTTFASFNKTAYIFSTHPIVDTKRWIGLDILVNFNDIFFMSLMFLIGGLFLMNSIRKKGRSAFIRERFFRLFIPFLLLGTLLMLLAYFPSYYVAHESTDIPAYIKDFFVVEYWPVGPPWFIWMLFLFNLLLAWFYSPFQKVSGRIGKYLTILKDKPFIFFSILFCLGWILYVPLAYSVGAGTWTGLGPFDFQLSRIFLYVGFFTLGILIGETDFNNEILSTQSAIVKNWQIWILLSMVVFIVVTIIGKPLMLLEKKNILTEFTGWLIYYSFYIASCILSCIAFLTVYRKLVQTGKSWLNSLSENAYLIYFIHYIFVIWCQFLLLNLSIPAFTKFVVTFIVALSLSWMTSILLRKIKIVEKYLS
jgi:glucans biosynthesis protein C